jgi:hypothetical protein
MSLPDIKIASTRRISSTCPLYKYIHIIAQIVTVPSSLYAYKPAIIDVLICFLNPAVKDIQFGSYIAYKA